MLKKRYSKDNSNCTVMFTIRPEQAGGAVKAMVLGDFNDWDQTEGIMKKTPDGGFELSIKLAAKREYQFRYLFDDTRWDNDWDADKYCLSPFIDAENGVVIV